MTSTASQGAGRDGDMFCRGQKSWAGSSGEPRVKVEANRDEMSKDDFMACPQSPDPSTFMLNILAPSLQSQAYASYLRHCHTIHLTRILQPWSDSQEAKHTRCHQSCHLETPQLGCRRIILPLSTSPHLNFFALLPRQQQDA